MPAIAASTDRHAGYVSYVAAERGFGFVVGPAFLGGLYFHQSALIGLAFDEQLRERDVTFSAIQSAHGWQAVAIRAAR